MVRAVYEKAPACKTSWALPGASSLDDAWLQERRAEWLSGHYTAVNVSLFRLPRCDNNNSLAAYTTPSNSTANHSFYQSQCEARTRNDGSLQVSSFPRHSIGPQQQISMQSQPAYVPIPTSHEKPYFRSFLVNQNFSQHQCSLQTAQQSSELKAPKIICDDLQQLPDADTDLSCPDNDNDQAMTGQGSSACPGLLPPRCEFSGRSYRSSSSSPSDKCSSPGSIRSWEHVDLEDCTEASEDSMDICPVSATPEEYPALGSMLNLRGTQHHDAMEQTPRMLDPFPDSKGMHSVAPYSQFPTPKNLNPACVNLHLANTNTSATIAGSGHVAHSHRERNLDGINRQLKACIRCQLLRVQCGLGDTCPVCQDNATPSIYPRVCVRIHLTEAKVYRTSALGFPGGIPKVGVWVSTRSVRIKLYNIGFTEETQRVEMRPRLDVVCREFPETPGIPARKCWLRNGKHDGVDVPRYAMPSKERSQTNEKLERLVKLNFKSLVTELKFGRDEIVSSALAEAARHVGECDALDGALNIAILSRLMSKSFNIAAGPETLGQGPILDPTSPYFGRIPIPPMLDAQLDDLFMQKMKPLQKAVLSRLKKMVFSNRKRNWFMIFLTIMVLLSNLEFIYQNQIQQIKRYGKTTDRLNIMMDSWEYAARNLIAHFHAICHGEIPLHMKWDKDAQQAAGMSEKDLDFLNELKKLVEPRAQELSWLATGPTGNTLVWISRLLLP